MRTRTQQQHRRSAAILLSPRRNRRGGSPDSAAPPHLLVGPAAARSGEGRRRRWSEMEEGGADRATGARYAAAARSARAAASTTAGQAGAPRGRLDSASVWPAQPPLRTADAASRVGKLLTSLLPSSAQRTTQGRRQPRFGLEVGAPCPIRHRLWFLQKQEWKWPYMQLTSRSTNQDANRK
ncbi:unnamed protein product [Urochloa humidicola]